MERPLHYYAYVEARFDLVTRMLAEDTLAVLQRATDDAREQANMLSRSLEVDVGGFQISRTVVIEVGEFEPREVTRSVVPLRWHAEKGGLLFPSLSANLEVSSVTFEPPLSQITVDGSYEPPLGLLGAGADRLVLHRLAEAAVHRFTNEVADQLRRLVSEIPEDERL